MNQLLHEAEGTEPGTGHPAYQAAYKAQKSQDIKADMIIAGGKRRPQIGKKGLKSPQWTGAHCGRTGIAVQAGNAYAFEFSLVYGPGKGEHHPGVAENRGQDLNPAPYIQHHQIPIQLRQMVMAFSRTASTSPRLMPMTISMRNRTSRK